MSPRYLRIPSKPNDSRRTLSPISKDLPVRLTLRPKTSEVRLDGRGIGDLEFGALREAIELRAEDDEAEEDGLPVTDRRPDCTTLRGDGGERDTSLERWFAGSLALIASWKDLEMKSSSAVGGYWPTVEGARGLPGVGMPEDLPGAEIPDARPFAGVVDMTPTNQSRFLVTSRQERVL